jgi:hypothetical protein
MASEKGLEWPLLVNITEEDWWGPYDTASNSKTGILDWATDNAWQDLENLDRHTTQDLIRDLVAAFIPKAKARKITSEDIDRIAAAFHADHRQFEAIRQAFTDASTWAWEAAYTPEDKDLDYALEYAKAAVSEEALPDYWNLLIKNQEKQGPKDWSPISRYTEKQLFNEIEGGITYRHEKGKWDRFVEFDLMSGPIVEHMRELLRAGEGKPWDIELPDLESDFKDRFVDPVLQELASRLDKRMQQVDVHMRVDFDEYWKTILKDKSYGDPIQEEILAFLKEYPSGEWGNREEA